MKRQILRVPHYAAVGCVQNARALRCQIESHRPTVLRVREMNIVKIVIAGHVPHLPRSPGIRRVPHDSGRSHNPCRIAANAFNSRQPTAVGIGYRPPSLTGVGRTHNCAVVSYGTADVLIEKCDAIKPGHCAACRSESNVLPPLVVRRIKPRCPTKNPVVSFKKQADSKSPATFVVSGSHVRPESTE